MMGKLVGGDEPTEQGEPGREDELFGILKPSQRNPEPTEPQGIQ